MHGIGSIWRKPEPTHATSFLTLLASVNAVN